MRVRNITYCTHVSTPKPSNVSRVIIASAGAVSNKTVQPKVKISCAFWKQESQECVFQNMNNVCIAKSAQKSCPIRAKLTAPSHVGNDAKTLRLPFPSSYPRKTIPRFCVDHGAEVAFPPLIGPGWGAAPHAANKPLLVSVAETLPPASSQTRKGFIF